MLKSLHWEIMFIAVFISRAIFYGYILIKPKVFCMSRTDPITVSEKGHVQQYSHAQPYLEAAQIIIHIYQHKLR